MGGAGFPNPEGLQTNNCWAKKNMIHPKKRGKKTQGNTPKTQEKKHKETQKHKEKCNNKKTRKNKKARKGRSGYTLSRQHATTSRMLPTDRESTASLLSQAE